jgi:hypothetical protein
MRMTALFNSQSGQCPAAVQQIYRSSKWVGFKISLKRAEVFQSARLTDKPQAITAGSIEHNTVDNLCSLCSVISAKAIVCDGVSERLALASPSFGGLSKCL